MKTLSEHIQESFNENKEENQQTVVETDELGKEIAITKVNENKEE